MSLFSLPFFLESCGSLAGVVRSARLPCKPLENKTLKQISQKAQAEWIEKTAELEIIKGLGIRLAQGILLGRPQGL